MGTRPAAIQHFVVLSGCCGGGKSTLLAELGRRGHAVVMEPGRRILAEERQGDGGALPWVDAGAFARRALEMSVADFEEARGLTFFDRGVVDAGVAMVASGGRRPAAAIERHRYDLMFLAPPWPEIYENDEDRPQSFEKAQKDFERVKAAYVEVGYDPVPLPFDTVPARADYVLAAVGRLLDRETDPHR